MTREEFKYMFGIEQLMNFMGEIFGLVIEGEVGEETVLLYHEELEKELIPEDVLEILPNPILFHTYIYYEQSEWIIGIALGEKTNIPLFLVCLRDGARVYGKLLNEDEKNNI